jgi:predicted phage baseplate assembly protein
VMDREKDEVLFGDGLSGLIPPVLPGNIRLTRYRSGGGIAGNQPAQAIKQLVTAVPYIQKVVNWTAADGGSDPESMPETLERGPRLLRHRGRAVTAEDFEDLAQLASREVARARCIPQLDLGTNPNAERRKPGSISVVVVPRSDDPKPVPNSDLLDRVYSFLESRCLATTELVVVGPDYVRVDVDVEIVVDRLDNASDVERKVTQAIKSYLHPVNGGPNNTGWDFGRLPQRFDLYVLIERIAGVSHIRNLRMTVVADRPGAEKTKHFLICCGRHQVTMTL